MGTNSAVDRGGDYLEISSTLGQGPLQIWKGDLRPGINIVFDDQYRDSYIASLSSSRGYFIINAQPEQIIYNVQAPTHSTPTNGQQIRTNHPPSNHQQSCRYCRIVLCSKDEKRVHYQSFAHHHIKNLLRKFGENLVKQCRVGSVAHFASGSTEVAHVGGIDGNCSNGTRYQVVEKLAGGFKICRSVPAEFGNNNSEQVPSASTSAAVSQNRDIEAGVIAIPVVDNGQIPIALEEATDLAPQTMNTSIDTASSSQRQLRSAKPKGNKLSLTTVEVNMDTSVSGAALNVDSPIKAITITRGRASKRQKLAPPVVKNIRNRGAGEMTLKSSANEEVDDGRMKLRSSKMKEVGGGCVISNRKSAVKRPTY